MTLQLLHSEFPYIWGKFYSFFISVARMSGQLEWLESLNDPESQSNRKAGTISEKPEQPDWSLRQYIDGTINSVSLGEAEQMCCVNNSTSQISRIFFLSSGRITEGPFGAPFGNAHNTCKCHKWDVLFWCGFPNVKKLPHIWPILSGNKRKGIRMLNVVLNFADDLCKQ